MNALQKDILIYSSKNKNPIYFPRDKDSVEAICGLHNCRLIKVKDDHYSITNFGKEQAEFIIRDREE